MKLKNACQSSMNLFTKNVVPENIYTPHGGQRKFRGEEGAKKTQFPRRWGVASWNRFPGASSKTGELSKTNSCSVKQAISYFNVNTLSKQELLFLVDDILSRDGWILFFFHGLRDR